MKRLVTILTLLLFSLASSAQLYCCVIKTNGGNATNYTVEKVVRLNLSNQYESAAQQPGSPVWNLCNATDVQVQAAGGFVKSSLLDETGAAASGWAVTNLTAFQATTGSAPTPATVNSGLYPDAIVAYGWVMPATGDMTIRLSGLSALSSYQVHLLANDEPWKNTLVTASVGSAQSTAVNANNNYGASTDNEYAAAYVCHVKNAHCTSAGVLDIVIHASNGNNPNIVAIVIQQTNVDAN